MKDLFKITHAAWILMLAAVMLCASGRSAYAAADAASLDPDRTGSVSLTLADDSGTTVTDGAVTMYQAAALALEDGSMDYAWTDAFAACGETPDVTDTNLAASLADYVEEHQITGTTASLDAEGTVCFDGLSLGLYLVVQTTQSTGYNAISPFLVTVPLAENETWVYEVDASPKVEVYTETAAPPESTTTITTTTTTTTTTAATLPQTGQLYWPVPLLAAGGLALLATGRGLVMSDRRKRDHAV